MFESFFRKSTEQPSKQRVQPTNRVGDLTSVIVPRSAVLRAADPDRAHELVQAVVNFVNAMLTTGQYNRLELPARAIQVYHVDYYLGQVLNGGHSQFIGNGRSNLKHLLPDIRAGLAGMKAHDHLFIFERMAKWIAKNPEEASVQTGFTGGKAVELSEIDRDFYALEKTAPLCALSARWICSWSQLKAVGDAEYKQTMQRTALLNPLREARLVTQSVSRLRQHMMNWFHAGVGLACANSPRPEVKLAVGGGTVLEVEGASQTAFFVRTNADRPRFCVVTNKHAAAYEYVNESPPMPPPGDVDGFKQAVKDGRLARVQPPRVGKKLSHVDGETIAAVVSLADRYQAAAALDLMLRNAGIETEGAAVSPKEIVNRPEGPMLSFLVLAGRQAFYAFSTQGGSTLCHADGSGGPIVVVRNPEIQSHAARAEAYAVEVN